MDEPSKSLAQGVESIHETTNVSDICKDAETSISTSIDNSNAEKNKINVARSLNNTNNSTNETTIILLNQNDKDENGNSQTISNHDKGNTNELTRGKKFSIWTGGREDDNILANETQASKTSLVRNLGIDIDDDNLTDEEVVGINRKLVVKYSDEDGMEKQGEAVMETVCDSEVQHKSLIALSSSPREESTGDEIEVVKTPKSAINLMKTVTVDFVYSPENLSLNSVSLSSSMGKNQKVKTPKSNSDIRNARPLSADIEGTPSSRQNRFASFSFNRSSPSPRHSPYLPRESRSVSPSHHVDDFVSGMPPASMFTVTSCHPENTEVSSQSLQSSSANKFGRQSLEALGNLNGLQNSGTTGNGSYVCRYCSFSTNTYAQYQHHLQRHESPKCLKCPVCDFSTNDRYTLRRHRRVHMGTSTADIIRCDRCDFSTVLPRKYREHLAQAHGLQISSSHYGFQYQSPIIRQGFSSLNDRIHPFDLTPHANTMSLSNTSRSSNNNPVNTSYLRGIQGSLTFKDSANLVPRESVGAFSTYGVPPNNHLTNDMTRGLAPGYLQTMTSVANNPVQDSHAINGSLNSGSRFLSQQQFNVHIGQGQVKVKQEPPESPQACHSFHDPENILIDRPVRRSLNTNFSVMPSRRNTLAVDFSARSVSASFDLNRSQGAPAIDPVFTRNRDRLSFHQNSNTFESFEMQRPTRSRLGASHLIAMDTPRSRDGNENISGFLRLDRSRSRSRSMGENTECNGCRFHGNPPIQSVQESISVKQEPSPELPDTEMPSVGVQCRIPSVKSESVSRESSARESNVHSLVDQATQCEILSTVHLMNSRPVNNDNESDYSSESQSFQLPGHRCNHCGIIFDDEVLFSIHIGCHSHTDPFVCNVCGKHCGNKYGFYSHIMRGHHF